jgi:hypothetical protein
LLIMCPARLLLALTVIRGTADALSPRHAAKSNFPAASKRGWMSFPQPIARARATFWIKVFPRDHIAPAA